MCTSIIISKGQIVQNPVNWPWHRFISCKATRLRFAFLFAHLLNQLFLVHLQDQSIEYWFLNLNFNCNSLTFLLWLLSHHVTCCGSSLPTVGPCLHRNTPTNAKLGITKSSHGFTAVVDQSNRRSGCVQQLPDISTFGHIAVILKVSSVQCHRHLISFEIRSEHLKPRDYTLARNDDNDNTEGPEAG